MKVRKTRAEIEYIKYLPSTMKQYCNSTNEMCAVGKLPLLLNKAQGPVCSITKLMISLVPEADKIGRELQAVVELNDTGRHYQAFDFMIKTLQKYDYLEIIENKKPFVSNIYETKEIWNPSSQTSNKNLVELV